MPVSTIFTETENQLWAAWNIQQRETFPTLEALKSYLEEGVYHGLQAAWEETVEDSKGRLMRPCSRLLVCTVSIKYGGQYTGQVWKDTSWRAWRER